MNIVVCIKQVPGTNKVSVDEKTGVLKREGVDSKMNPYDLYAIETALRLKEAYGGQVSVMTMGPPQAKEIIREAFSMGADAGCLITDHRFAGADVLATARTLSQGIVLLGEVDVIVCGKQTTDGDTAQVGSEIAEFMGIPSLANVTKLLGADGESITVEMETPTAQEISQVYFPCLISVDKDIFLPRLPSYLKKKATADREIRTLTLDDFADRDEKHYGLSGSPTQVQRIFPPAAAGERELLRGDSETLSLQITERLRQRKFV